VQAGDTLTITFNDNREIDIEDDGMTVTVKSASDEHIRLPQTILQSEDPESMEV
jgi:hypothetical protein